MKQEKLDRFFEKFLEMLKQLYVNIPLTEVLTQMPAYAKFLKEIMSSKSASINLMPLSMFKKLEGELGVIKSILVSLQLDDQTTIILEGIIDDIVVRVGKFVFPVDFIVVDMEVNKKVPLILERPFLCTDRAILDIYEGQLMLRVGNEIVIFQIKRMIKYPCDEASAHTCFKLDMVGELAKQHKLDKLPMGQPHTGCAEKGGMTVVKNEDNELIPTRTVASWRMCIDYRRLYNQLPIAPEDVEKTTFTFLSRIFAYQRMPFGLCNAPATFQRCMMSIFSDLNGKCMKVFMDDFNLFGDDFKDYLRNLELVLKRYENTHLLLNWEKCHFMVKEGIVVGQKVTAGGFYRKFIKNLSSITKPLIALLAKDVKFVIDVACLRAFEMIKKKQVNYATTEKEFFVVVFTFDKFRSYLVGSMVIVHTDYSALIYLMSKKESKPHLMRWVLLLQEFDLEIKDRKGTKNQVADHLLKQWTFGKSYQMSRCFPLQQSLIDLHGEHKMSQVNELEEFRLDAYENVQIFKEKMKKDFYEGENVLLYNSRLRLFRKKFKSRWTGPYVVKHVLPYGAIEAQNMEGTKSFKVNGHRLKPYLAGGFDQQSLSIIIS
ncbi:uncharacterized protein LOC142180118 [Nicotiana tabacum]|uniref:Uncharacterized protein LOC142180118 n=1 Tax=Nicotiana tabacum TaxID=4097 RepID=A0AC58UCC6_TOBAC